MPFRPPPQSTLGQFVDDELQLLCADCGDRVDRPGEKLCFDCAKNAD